MIQYPLMKLQKLTASLLDQGLKRINPLVIRCQSSNQRLVSGFGVRALLLVRRAGLALKKGARYTIYRVQGVDPVTGGRLRTIYILEGKSAEYLHQLIYHGETIRQEEIGTCRRWNLRSTARRLAGEADLVVVEGDQGWRPSSGDWVRAPTWVRLLFHYRPHETWDQLQLRLKRQEKNIRKIQRAGYSFSISQNEDDFDYFYDQMYVPLIRSRHKNYGIIETRETLHEYFEQGFLLFVMSPDQVPVAGNILVAAGTRLWACASGVIDADRRVIENGSQSALYYYCFQLGVQNGMKTIDAGLSRPFLHDGILTYEQRWGFEPAADLWQTRKWLFWVPNGSEAALDWLARNPVLPQFAEYRGRNVGKVYRNFPAAG